MIKWAPNEAPFLLEKKEKNNFYLKCKNISLQPEKRPLAHIFQRLILKNAIILKKYTING